MKYPTFLNYWYWILAACLSTCYGCATSHYYFRPIQIHSQFGTHAPGDIIQVNESSKTSTIQIKCLGIEALSSLEKKAIFFRIFFDNHGKQPWTLNLRQQQVLIASTPLEAVLLSPEMPKLFPPGPTQFLDMGFKLPQGQDTYSQIPELVFNIKLLIGSIPFEYSSSFVRDRTSGEGYGMNAAHTQDHHRNRLQELNNLWNTPPGTR